MRCPVCLSKHPVDERGSRPACSQCGWRGEPYPPHTKPGPQEVTRDPLGFTVPVCLGMVCDPDEVAAVGDILRAFGYRPDFYTPEAQAALQAGVLRLRKHRATVAPRCPLCGVPFSRDGYSAWGLSWTQPCRCDLPKDGD